MAGFWYVARALEGRTHENPPSPRLDGRPRPGRGCRGDPGAGGRAARHRALGHGPQRCALQRLLRVRQRRLARGPSDPGFDAPLEPPVGGGGVVQGPAEGHPRGGLDRPESFQGEHRSAHRGLLRRVHGDEPAQRRRSPASPAPAHGDRRHEERRRPAEDDRPPPVDRDRGSLRSLGGLGQPQPGRRDRADLRQRPRDARPRLLPEDRAALRGRAGQVPGPRRRHVSAGRCFRAGREGRRGRGLSSGEAARRRLARQRGAAGPEGHGPQDIVRGPPEADSPLRLDGVCAAGGPDARRRQRDRTAFPGGGQPPALRHAPGRLEDLSEVAAARLGRAVAVGRVRPRELRFQRRLPAGREGDQAALEALRGVDGPSSRRGAREEVRREVLPAGREGPDAGDGAQPAHGDGPDDRRPRLDERGDQEAGAREARDVQPEDRLPRPVEGLQPRADRPGVVLERRRRGPTIQRRGRSRDDRQAGRPRPLGA